MRTRWPVCILTGALAIMATCVAAMSARAAPLESCPVNKGIYRATTDDRYEIEFSEDYGAAADEKKAGVLRYRGRARTIKYEFQTTWSNGLANLYVIIEADRKRNADPKALDKSGPEARWISSQMLPLGSDFSFHQSNETAAPYLVIPNLGREFYYWPEEQARHPAEKITPPQAWKLVRCRD